ncbi:MAG: hypothetical protein IIA17_05590, partial [candidate division Zixibacteria bacterium]|nr:hypothetical protein [candidate division Zixibacteria bacterium]
MKYYKLKQPDHAKVLSKALDKMFKKPIDFSSYFVKTIQPKYLFWDKVQYLPRPHGVTAEEFWALVKFSRNASPERTTPVKDKNGNFFTWRTLPILDSFFHEIDMQFGGKLELSAVMDDSSRQRFISRGIMEEAIASSQLEGASTTRRVARRMIVENRKPKNKSEHMILNNYRAMIHVEENLRKEPLTASKVLEFHRILTENT